ncbi:DUF6262 family protein [Streptomyces sp. A5-4]|uniref:DUF6262 family protein n=1 Tax=Streptomyces sp. A5-4 TaxID=3384771 RepID=UPI003DA8867A
MTPAKRTPGDVLRESRKKDSAAKRAKVLSTLDAMRARGETVTFLGVARTAGVSNWLVYSAGMREHIEAAIAGQSKTGRRTRQAGGQASSASLATDLELLRADNKALREERDRLKKAVQRGLGAQLDQAGTKELTERVGELLTAVEQLVAERDEARGERDALRRQLTESEDDLVAAREAGKRLLRQVNRPT